MEVKKMAVVRWNPWGELFSLHDQMDQLFQHTAGTEVVNLPVDIRQTDDRFVIEASIPGFKPEDVEVTFDDGVLSIRGRLESQHESKEGGYVRRERHTSSVFRQISLPNDVQADEITAGFENGVLTVTVPRAAKAQPKRIPVKAEKADSAKVIESTSPAKS
jgi:HSP20 family protein